ncbi:hypothetical protein F4779DRAFT_641211 [Xylariaceae sp. FL0662B]|nr:hypothetical protein F4779DRAFT_641211 [Xylariaceae sp. FL0662B]
MDGQPAPHERATPNLQFQRLYDAGAAIWTKQDFRDMEASLARGNRSHVGLRPVGNSIYYQTVYNTSYAERPNYPGFINEQTIRFNGYFDLLYDLASANSRDHPAAMSMGTARIPFSLGTNPVELRALFEQQGDIWRAGTTCAQLKAFIAKASIPHGVNKIICFDLGSLDRRHDDNHFESISPSIEQHTAALTMAQALREKFGGEVELVAQDPTYNPSTRQILQVSGFRVVDGFGSLAFTEVDEKCLVFSSAPNVPVKEIVADIARPAVMIWDTVRAEDWEAPREWKMVDNTWVNPWSPNPDTPRTVALVQGYDKTSFADDFGSFGNLSIRGGGVLSKMEEPMEPEIDHVVEPANPIPTSTKRSNRVTKLNVKARETPRSLEDGEATSRKTRTSTIDDETKVPNKGRKEDNNGAEDGPGALEIR